MGGRWSPIRWTRVTPVATAPTVIHSHAAEAPAWAVEAGAPSGGAHRNGGSRRRGHARVAGDRAIRSSAEGNA